MKSFLGTTASQVSVQVTKRDAMIASTLKAAVKEAVGTCVSIGLTVNDLDPKEVLTNIDEGKYDSSFE